MTNDERWTLVWATWAVAFGVAETIAIRSKNPTAPLSHTIRRCLGVRRTPMQRRLGQVAFASGTAWLTIHLWREVKSDG